jgi:hypothetical protein
MTSAGGGLVGFARAVHHPGTRADPFVADGVADARRELEGDFSKAGDRLASNLAKSMTRRA